jgi:biopolymer transport protein ExbD
VVVSADGDVTHRRVIEAMDAVRVAGISRMAIAVQSMERR